MQKEKNIKARLFPVGHRICFSDSGLKESNLKNQWNKFKTLLDEPYNP